MSFFKDKKPLKLIEAESKHLIIQRICQISPFKEQLPFKQK